MKRTAKCNYCDFTVTKNGIWRTMDVMKDHVVREHPKEYTAVRRHNRIIDGKILKLKEQRKMNWEFID